MATKLAMTVAVKAMDNQRWPCRTHAFQFNGTSFEDELKRNVAVFSLFAPGPPPVLHRTAASQPWRRQRPASDPAGSPPAPCGGACSCALVRGQSHDALEGVGRFVV